MVFIFQFLSVFSEMNYEHNFLSMLWNNVPLNFALICPFKCGAIRRSRLALLEYEALASGGLAWLHTRPYQKKHQHFVRSFDAIAVFNYISRKSFFRQRNVIDLIRVNKIILNTLCKSSAKTNTKIFCSGDSKRSWYQNCLIGFLFFSLEFSP